MCSPRRNATDPRDLTAMDYFKHLLTKKDNKLHTKCKLQTNNGQKITKKLFFSIITLISVFFKNYSLVSGVLLVKLTRSVFIVPYHPDLLWHPPSMAQRRRTKYSFILQLTDDRS